MLLIKAFVSGRLKCVQLQPAKSGIRFLRDMLGLFLGQIFGNCQPAVFVRFDSNLKRRNVLPITLQDLESGTFGKQCDQLPPTPGRKRQFYDNAICGSPVQLLC
jgi:hypothetical protein